MTLFWRSFIAYSLIIQLSFLLRRNRQCYSFFGRTRKDLKVHSFLTSSLQLNCRKFTDFYFLPPKYSQWPKLENRRLFMKYRQSGFHPQSDSGENLPRLLRILLVSRSILWIIHLDNGQRIQWRIPYLNDW